MKSARPHRLLTDVWWGEDKCDTGDDHVAWLSPLYHWNQRHYTGLLTCSITFGKLKNKSNDKHQSVFVIGLTSLSNAPAWSVFNRSTNKLETGATGNRVTQLKVKQHSLITLRSAMVARATYRLLNTLCRLRVGDRSSHEVRILGRAQIVRESLQRSYSERIGWEEPIHQRHSRGVDPAPMIGTMRLTRYDPDWSV